jgi:hypothetical protein
VLMWGRKESCIKDIGLSLRIHVGVDVGGGGIR